jgi:hypothetical protein
MSNPFSGSDIPGMNSMGDPLGFIKKLWGSMNVPGMVAPPMSVDELDKKIQDLKTVESWLNVNMNMLRGTIQALEVQRATIATLQSLGENFAQHMQQASAQAKPVHKPVRRRRIFRNPVRLTRLIIPAGLCHRQRRQHQSRADLSLSLSLSRKVSRRKQRRLQRKRQAPPLAMMPARRLRTRQPGGICCRINSSKRSARQWKAMVWQKKH